MSEKCVVGYMSVCKPPNSAIICELQLTKAEEYRIEWLDSEDTIRMNPFKSRLKM